MKAEFASLRAADESGIPTLLDTYGATDPVEFFAVSVEAFFERPRALRARHPKLYAELQKYFQQDPVQYSAERQRRFTETTYSHCGCGTMRRYGFGAFQPCG